MLGVGEGADRQAVRRAYLAAVKSHPPERDPEGFQRVRAAFELLRQLAPAPEAEAPETAIVSSPASSAAHVVALVPISTEAPIDRYYERAEECRNAEEREWLGREAVARLGSREAYQLLVDSVDDPRATVQVMREAIARGHVEQFLPQLARRFPEALDDSELEQLQARVASGQDALGWPLLASTLLKKGRARSAGELIVAKLESLRREPLAPRPWRFWVTGLGLELLERGEIAHARRALELEAAAYAGERQSPDFVTRQEMARELAGVADALPAELVTGLARSLRGQTPDEGDWSLQLFGLHHAREARKVRKVLKRSAPLLFQSYGPALAGPKHGGRTLWAPERPWYAGIGGFWLIYLVFRLVIQPACMDRSPTPKVAQNVNAPQVEPEFVRALCANSQKDPALCAGARRMLAAKTCGDAASALEMIDRAATERARGEAISGRVDEALVFAHDLFQKQCRPVTPKTSSTP